MPIHLNHHSGEPIYRQIVEALKLDVARGKLKEGDKLPSIRELANELGINMRTVVKAYEELVSGGLAVMQQGRGVFITESKQTLPAARRREIITDLAQRMVAEAKRLGATSAEVKEILNQVVNKMEPPND